MVHTLKVVWTSNSGGSETRRVTVDDEVISKYDLLAEKIQKLFPQLTGQCLQLGWKDPDGDYVVMSSDEELAQAVANAVESGVIRLFVSAEAHKNADHKPKSPVVHPNIFCDGCSGSVCGYRYKCLECIDYDLCESCHMVDKHPRHDMLKIAVPVGQSRKWVFPGLQPMYQSLFGIQPCGPQCDKEKNFGSKCSQEESEEKEKRARSAQHSHAEFLKRIGKSMSFLLDPLGIDVDVMVPDGGGTASSDGNQKAAEAQTEFRNKLPRSVSEEKAKADTVFNDSTASPVSQSKDEHSSNAVTPSQDVGAEADAQPQGACPKNYGLFQKPQDDTGNMIKKKESRESSPGNFSAHDDWTIVNDVPNMHEGKNGNVVNPATVDMKVSSCPPVSEKKIPSLPSWGGAITETPPKDPKISSALVKMCAMGFTNEGGWLVRLLEAKNGNINEVLDAMYPNHH